jgi:acyl carrier protein
MPAQTDVWETVVEHLRAVKPSLRESALGPQSSLTADLGLDSLDLMALSARLTAELPEFDMLPWLSQAADPGMDTLATFVAHCRRQAEQAADSRAGIEEGA